MQSRLISFRRVPSAPKAIDSSKESFPDSWRSTLLTHTHPNNNATSHHVLIFFPGISHSYANPQAELRDAMYSFGEIASVNVKAAKAMAFVEYSTRGAAEAAVRALHRTLTVNRTPLQVAWAHPRDLDG
jgi:RNA recognition motif. (a.k.a. RRM, RBD, or RNP domain)